MKISKDNEFILISDKTENGLDYGIVLETGKNIVLPYRAWKSFTTIEQQLELNVGNYRGKLTWLGNGLLKAITKNETIVIDLFNKVFITDTDEINDIVPTEKSIQLKSEVVLKLSNPT
jgi:hypothetical protein